MKKAIIHTDGGSRGNPGPSAIGVWISILDDDSFSKGMSVAKKGGLDKKYSAYIGEKTNNIAEYEALIFSLEKLKKLLGKEKAKQYEVKCYLDSELVVRQLSHQYRIKEKNTQSNFLQVWNLMLDFKKVEFYHIPREENKVADKLVNEALDAREKQKSLL